MWLFGIHLGVTAAENDTPPWFWVGIIILVAVFIVGLFVKGILP